MSRLIQSVGERTIMEPPGGQPPLVTNPYGPAAYTPLSAWQHNMAGFSAYGPPVWPNIEPASDVVEDSRVVLVPKPSRPKARVAPKLERDRE